jgi:hypothetical protein
MFRLLVLLPSTDAKFYFPTSAIGLFSLVMRCCYCPVAIVDVSTAPAAANVVALFVVADKFTIAYVVVGVMRPMLPVLSLLLLLQLSMLISLFLLLPARVL